MAMVHVYRSAGDIPGGDWRELANLGIDQSQAYLRFREVVEPGAPVVVVARHGERLAAGMHGALTTPQTALFSHPWKMLSDNQFLRLGDDAGAHQVTQQHQLLLSGLLSEHRREPPGWQGLTDSLGEAIVIRGFDTSAPLVRANLSAEEKFTAIVAVLRKLQELVVDGVAGAVAMPFVHPHDTLPRHALAECGFRAGVLTGASVFELSGARTYEELLAKLPKRRRRRYKIEQEAFKSSGMTARTVNLNANLERIVELEASNVERYGGTPDRARLMKVRATMSEFLGDAIRVPVAELAGEIVACGIDLMDDDNYLGLVYGCDYSVPQLGMAYSNLVFYEPIKFAVKRHIRQLRFGFEAFAPKLYRGARLEAREMWLWLPSESTLDRLARLLDFFSDRAHAFFAGLAAPNRYIPPGWIGEAGQASEAN